VTAGDGKHWLRYRNPFNVAAPMRLRDDRDWYETSLLRKEFMSLGADLFDDLRAIYRR
jgi:hypothetical protein